MTKTLYRIYQLIIALPVMLLMTALTAIVTTIGCTLGSAHFWGHYPAMIWSRMMCWFFLLPMRVEGREFVDRKSSYVFVSNHQGAFDIFMIYGFLGRNFKWMMKKSLRSIPLVGKACESAGHIFVDKSGPKAVLQTCDKARRVLRDGTSLVVFPEGARTSTGKMGTFHKGAYLLADELQLPVVPVTINGSYDVLSRHRGFNFLTWHPLRMTIHHPIYPEGQGMENVQMLMDRSREVIQQDLPEKYRD